MFIFLVIGSRVYLLFSVSFKGRQIIMVLVLRDVKQFDVSVKGRQVN